MVDGPAHVDDRDAVDSLVLRDGFGKLEEKRARARMQRIRKDGHALTALDRTSLHFPNPPPPPAAAAGGSPIVKSGSASRPNSFAANALSSSTSSNFTPARASTSIAVP